MRNAASGRTALRALLPAIAVALLASVQPAYSAEKHHTAIPAEQIAWGPGPATLPPGAQAAVLHGSPAKEGPFVLRLKFPAGYAVAPHTHTKDEMVTVISGKFALGTGDGTSGSMQTLMPGSFVHMPAGTPHHARAEDETVVQINGMGPFDVVYLDPKMDPRNR